MVQNQAYAAYNNSKILTASPAELTLMLYDGAIKFANIAIMAIEKHDIEKAHNNIVKTERIILEFQATLDDKYPVAKDFDAVYTYLIPGFLRLNHHTFVCDYADTLLQLANLICIFFFICFKFCSNLCIKFLKASDQFFQLLNAGRFVFHRFIKLINRTCLIRKLVFLQIVQANNLIQHFFFFLQTLKHDC